MAATEFPSVLGHASGGSSFKYHYVTFLGRGGYGRTFVVTRVEDQTQCVCKIIPLAKSCLDSAKAVPVMGDAAAAAAAAAAPAKGAKEEEKARASSYEKVTTEMNNLSRVSRHFGVTEFFDAYIVNGHALLFMEFCDAGDLHQEINRRKRQKQYIDEQTMLVVLVQLIFSLHHLHINSMMHRDIKASNVLLCTNGLVKLGDFGLSKTQDVASTFCGTPSSLSPEVWSRNRYGRKADVWSLGVVMYQMVAQKMPFRGGYDELRRCITQGKFTRLSELQCPGFRPEVLGLCDKMMTIDPDSRPDTRQLLQEPVLAPVVEMFPRLLQNSPNVSAELRAKVYRCLVEDGILSDTDGKPSAQLPRPSADVEDEACDVSLPSADPESAAIKVDPDDDGSDRRHGDGEFTSLSVAVAKPGEALSPKAAAAVAGTGPAVQLMPDSTPSGIRLASFPLPAATASEGGGGAESDLMQQVKAARMRSGGGGGGGDSSMDRPISSHGSGAPSSAVSAIVIEGSVWKGKSKKDKEKEKSKDAKAEDTTDKKAVAAEDSGEDFPSRWEKRYLVLTDAFLALSEDREPTGGPPPVGVPAGPKLRVRELCDVSAKPDRLVPGDAFRTKEEKERRKREKAAADGPASPDKASPKDGSSPDPEKTDRRLWPIEINRDDGVKFVIALETKADFQAWHTNLERVLAREKERAEKRRARGDVPGALSH